MKTFFTIAVLLVLGAAYYFWIQPVLPVPVEEGTPTTTASETALATSTRIEARIDESASALGVSIVPTDILEDSRCPLDVVCIQAGTVRIRASLTSGMGTALQEFTLGTPITTEAEVITLVEVLPAPHSRTQLTPGDYRLVFEIQKR